MCSMRRSSTATGQPGRYVYGTSAAVTAETVPTKTGGIAVVEEVAVTTPVLGTGFAARVADVVPVQPPSQHAVPTSAAARAPGRAMKAYRSPALQGSLGGYVWPAATSNCRWLLSEGVTMSVRRSSTAVVQEAVAQLNDRGYAIVERRADPAVMDRLLQEVQPYADKAELLKLEFFGGGLRKVESVVTKSHAFVSLLADPLLHELSEAMLGHEPLLNGASVFFLEKGGRDQTLHNDGTIYEPMLPRAPG